MSFGFSVGDLVATAQLCFEAASKIYSVTRDSSSSHTREIETLKRLTNSLNEVIDVLTSTQSNKVLAQEEFQIPLRDGFAQIRRDIESLSQSTKYHDLIEANGLLIEDAANLTKLLSLATNAKDTTSNQEILLTIEALSVATTFKEDIQIRQWLLGSDNESLHHALISDCAEGTASWILKDEAYCEWKSSRNSLLWLRGGPGTGKSVLSAYIIETLRLASDHQVAFYHFSATSSYESSLERCLMSLIGQLISIEPQIERFIREFYRDHASGTMLPSVGALQQIILMIIPFISSCFIVLDGIDECSNLQETLEVLDALQRNDGDRARNPCILFTSRNLYEIQAALIEADRDGHTTYISLDAIFDKSTVDLQLFIDNELERGHGISRHFSAELKEQISTALLEKSNGMFLFARLALSRIHEARTINAVKKIINEPFSSLSQIYENMLLQIPPQNYGTVRRILIWVINSARPLTIDEVRDAIISNTIGEIVNPDDRLINLGDILRMCSSFLVEATGVNDDTGKLQSTLRLVHPSFIDYLRSKRTVGPLTDLQHSAGDRTLAHCCLTYLLTFSEGTSIPDGDLSDFPLLAYAAEYWPYHARRIEDAHPWHSDTTQLVMRLFHDNNGSSFSKWLKLFDPAAPRWSANSTPKIEKLSSPLFYASLLGLRHVLALLVESREKISTLELDASLFEATSKGYADIVQLLLEQGANPNTEESSGGRPLDAAILAGHKTIVELLLQYEANVTYENRIIGNPFRTAIHTASSSGDLALAILLLRTAKAKMPPEAFLKTLSQGLRDAARIGSLEVVQLLFNADENGDLDAIDESGCTALHYAIRFKHEDVQQYLIDHDANIDKRNLAGETPADFAWSDRRLDLTVYNKTIDLEKGARQAFSCHILKQLSDSGECQKSIFLKTFKYKNKNRVAKSTAKKAIIREHTILQRINHPFIVSYLWYNENVEQETAQLYLEFCNGGDLDKYSARATANSDEESSSDENDQLTLTGPYLMPKELWRYMFQVAAALAYLHHGLSLRLDHVFTFERKWDQILHRDVKPSNIVVNVPQNGLSQAKVCDLGLAKGLSSKTKEAKETGGIGTRNYWPPEMFQKGGFWTAKGDIYSYGSTFHDLWAKSTGSTRDYHPSKEILSKCMSTLPADRPSSIDLLEILRKHVLDQLPLATSNLDGLLGQSQAGYLHDAFYRIADHLDTKETFETRSVKVRRATLIKRLELLCDDGVGPLFDTQQGSPNMRLHIAVLLNREAAFNRALDMPEAINSGWADSGWTPLHLAAQENNVEMYTRLIEAEANPLVTDKSGHIASFYFPG